MVPVEDRVSPTRRFGAAFLWLQGTGAVFWWAAVLAHPGRRQLFLAPGAPVSTLLTLGLADLVFFIGGSFLSAYGLSRRRPWAWPVLCIHAGAAAYAAVCALTLPFLSGGAWAGALLMTPSLVIPLTLVWRLRPKADRPEGG